MSKLTNEDKSLFAEAVSDVTKLNTTSKVALTHPLRQKNSVGRQLLTSSHILSTTRHQDEETTTVDAQQKLTFKRPQLDAKAFKRLKSGLFQTLWQLDLHGLTETVADQQLQHFIHEAVAENARYLVIIHGKGYNSDIHKPVLKNLVNQRLRSFPQVLGFCSAQPKDGGSGAVYVFLQKLKPHHTI
ncbi:MAG: hypothetical protein GW843_03920 [Thiomicrospira sp.]|nr:hypothetical protein [Thiomicrospira sp.]OIP94242.1 MAG: hypothetical protein AUK56_09390 [Thiomicrospira sp. CG2_30_44_34]PIQ02755.1 MAG: hypothetical protein COW74_09715 [Piscirickettsiaceae bacterium CG18_big_fil_WC_8_21_14_2_50_44_103]PIU38569.1 MAG: hypothetical protein COT01_05720 [Piscirickettsiaceae bacterium CG07_land_8_20_14_0_80_44_28]NCN67074.1 hypothetical protein [Thiomicrospira sp.]